MKQTNHLLLEENQSLRARLAALEEQVARQNADEHQDLGELELSDLLDAPALQKLMDDFYAVAQIPMSIIDVHGKLLVGVGWQDICTRFHRVHPKTCQFCVESDTQLAAGIAAGESRLYKCKNGMWDMATPIIVAGRRVGSVFSGQFFFEDEVIDRALFRDQAHRYGFDEAAYLSALDRAPRISRVTISRGMAFFQKLAETLSQLGHSNLRLLRLLSERDRLAQRLQRAQQIAHLGSWELDLAQNRLTWTDEVYRIFGLRPQEFGATYEAFLQHVHPDDRAAVDEAYSGSLRENRDTYEIEHRVIRANTGEVRFVHEKCEHFRDANGRLIRSVGMVHDVTDARRAAEALRKSEGETRRQKDLLAVTLASIGDAVIVTDTAGRVTFLNGEAERLTGWKLSEAAGAPLAAVFRIINEETRQSVESPVAKVMRLGGVVGLANHTLLIAKDGTEIPIDDSGAPVRSPDGKVHGVVLVFRNIASRKEVEQALQHTRDRFALMSETAGALLESAEPQALVNELCEKVMHHLKCDVFINFMADDARGQLRLNAYAGISPEEAKCIEWLDYGVAVCGCAARDCVRIIAEDIAHSNNPQTTLVKSYGVQAYCCHPLMAGERVLGTLSFGSRSRPFFAADEVELMRAVASQVAVAMERICHEQALRQAKEDAESASRAKDQFIAVLSHELRTPLTPVVTSIAMLQEKPELDSETRETLEMIRRNVEMEARLIDDLLDITRIERGKIELKREVLDLAHIIQRAAEVCLPDIQGRSLAFHIHVSDGPHWVNVDAARLQQVFWNLLKNAVKFSPERGTLEINSWKDADGKVITEVRDEGEGIEPEVLSRLFRAFEQGGTRISRQFGGLGLGLAISKALVECHGGTIHAKSDGAGHGATFRVTLPICPAPTSQQSPDILMPGRETAGRNPGQYRILLVEDHRDTAAIMRHLLTRDGHTVRLASNVAAALSLAEAERFDLLISDLGLPDGSGLDLIAQLRRRRKSLPAIALSGYGQEHDVQRSREAGFDLHLTKPASPDQLREAIARVAIAR